MSMESMNFYRLLRNQDLEPKLEAQLLSIHMSLQNDCTNKKIKREIMDSLWNELYIKSNSSFSRKLCSYYSHPIWLYHGMCTFLDPELLLPRLRVAKFISGLKLNKEILDFGGGFGTLSYLIERACPESNICLYDPYSHIYVDTRVRESKRIELTLNLDRKKFDVVTCIDVIEHSNSPIRTISTIIEHMRPGGLLIVQNCFHPIIRCHIATTFYLRYFFRLVAWLSGIDYIGRVPDSYGFSIYIKSDRRPTGVQTLVNLSLVWQILFPIMRVLGFDVYNIAFNKLEIWLQVNFPQAFGIARTKRKLSSKVDCASAAG